MSLFTYTARNKQKQPCKGEFEATNRDVALATLRRQGLTSIQVKKKALEIKVFSDPKVTQKDISIFFRQLSTMINAGLPLLQCFELLQQGTKHKGLLKVFAGIQTALENGSPFGETLRKFPNEFDRLTCSLIQAGEQGGILDTILLRICDYKEKSLALKAKIKSAMIYPASILVTCFIVTTILMIFVVPVFAEMFSSFGASLPAPTQIVMTISDLFVEYWYIVIGTPILLFFTTKTIYKTPRGHYQLDKLLLHLPVIGDILRKGAVARFTRTFSTLIAAGVPILEAIDTVAETSGNLVIEQAVRSSKEAISQGQPLSQPLEESAIFPIMVTQMIGIGEQTGALEEMLSKIADFYEEEVSTAVDNMTSLMEPAIMIFLGIVIGGLVIAMYMPIFMMASVM